MRVPPLETERLVIRPFVIDDLDAIHRILDIELADAETGTEGAKTREERASWLQWTILAYEELARLHQPPYGDRAIALRGTRELVGACGYVPCLAPFGQVPALRLSTDATPGRISTEFGLYWAVSPAHQRRGYATEAARAVIAYAFAELGLARIVATTSYDNAPSIGVMRKVGMHIARNPYPDPPWFQVVGVLHHPT
jgi:RimJ/RimL family protein N-acetyltransferase